MTHLTAEIEKFTPKQSKALSCLLSCSSLKRAAEKAGCDRSTLNRYMADLAFTTELNRLRFLQLSAAAGSLQRNAERAAGILFEIAEDIDAPFSVRLSAARTILEAGIKFAETINLEERLTELERAENEK